MDHLWSPWRFRYLSGTVPVAGCIFCNKQRTANDAAELIVHRGSSCFVMLNLYPYTTGHLMVTPYEHVATLEETSEETLAELISLTRIAERHLRAAYRPDGLNIGMNIGSAAGAGVAGHIHMHVLPRWTGDANFMTTIGETRVLPEELSVTYDKLRSAFTGSST